MSDDEGGMTDDNVSDPAAARTLRAVIAASARAYGDRPYLEDVTASRVLTYRSLAETSQIWAAQLDRAGVPACGRVLVAIDDPLSFAVTHLGVVASGRCCIPVDPDAPDGDIARTVAALRPALVITDGTAPAPTRLLPSVAADRWSGRPLGDEDQPARAAAPRTSVRGVGTVRLRTSGSTGAPKTVELTEAQLVHVARGIAAHHGLRTTDRGYNPLPLFHVNAEVVGLLATLVSGGTLVLDRRFHRSGFWSLVERRGITWINAVPAILAILARDPLPRRPAALRFIRSASAALPAAIKDVVTGAFGEIVIESYGMTEAASQITATDLGGPPRRGSAGRPVGVELTVRADDGRAAAPGAVGRVWIRGPGVIRGYVDGRAAERFDHEGWLDTGDLGMLDEDGYLYLAGRADDVINRGGELVYPREIEEVLMGDHRVLDAIAVGRPDDILGQTPVAYVIARERPRTDADAQQLHRDLEALCTRELSRFKRPAQLLLVDDLPRAPTGKIRRAEVRHTDVRHAMADRRGADTRVGTSMQSRY